MNVVPTPATRTIAYNMLRDAVSDTGADAALRWLPKVEPAQVAALVGVLLTNSKLNEKPGRPRKPLTYTEEDRRKANRQYKAGLRDEWTVNGWREYQRAIQHDRKERKGRS